MDPFKENELFMYFKNKHEMILTGKEIREIEKKIRENDEPEMDMKIISYRVTNVVAFLVIVLIAYDMAIRVLVSIFVVYNLAHIGYGLYLNRRSRKKSNKSSVS